MCAIAWLATQPKPASNLYPVLIRLFHLVRDTYSRLAKVDLFRVAGSLTFTTLLAIVPLVTVALAFVSYFPAFETWFTALERFMIRHVLPDSTGEIVHNTVMGFAEQATHLTKLSIAFIVVTAVLALNTVDSEINAIWGLRRPGRSLMTRIPVYVVGLTAGPVLLGASISLTTWILGQSLAAVPVERSVGVSIFRTLPFFFATAGLTLLYKGVPARKVALMPSLIAGMLAAFALEVLKWGLAWYLARVPTYALVYGAMAALPVFLLWIHACWTIVMVGAALTAALCDARQPRSS